MTGMQNVLILCTGNSCRSQMAEGYLRQFGGDRFSVYSAGMAPKDKVHPMAVEVMAEDDVDISDQRPKDIGEYLGKLHVAYLVIVCDKANETCPRVFPGMGERLYWPFDDPDGHGIKEFRRVRDEIKGQIVEWLADRSED